MILYTLACDANHRFEAWFRGSDAFTEQAGSGLVTCPTCGSASVRKAIMAPAILGARHVADAPAPPDSSKPKETQDVTLLDPRHREMRSIVRAFREKVLAESQDVGTQFPTEARRMHEGEIPNRHIRGQATPDQARALLEDGISVLPLPALPDDLN